MDLASSTFGVIRFYAILTAAGQALALALIAVLVMESVAGFHDAVTRWVSDRGLMLMLIVSLLATLGSLFFSEIAGWTPCKYCWLQRIFMYPQAVLLVIALWKRDRSMARYILALSVIGLLIAAWHYGEQVQAALQPIVGADGKLIPCDNSGESCARTQIRFTFGFVTIPMMAVTAFLLNIIGSVIMLRRDKSA